MRAALSWVSTSVRSRSASHAVPTAPATRAATVGMWSIGGTCAACRKMSSAMIAITHVITTTPRCTVSSTIPPVTARNVAFSPAAKCGELRCHGTYAVIREMNGTSANGITHSVISERGLRSARSRSATPNTR